MLIAGSLPGGVRGQSGGSCEDPDLISPINRSLSAIKKPASRRNAVHLSGAALRFTGKRVFDIFTALGLDGLGRFSMNMTPMQP
ncbi:hypothetical protein ACEUDO_19945, partial [Aeromonas rivipollensis]|uniref:hypothetical protein n=1 Tax=Aeromonas rivipollensis TaxID=948519 RepID=UPI0038E02FB9